MSEEAFAPAEDSWAAEVSERGRFRFGKNWARYLTALDEDRIIAAQRSLQNMLGCETLAGRRLLDVGSGSGLFSLAAKRLGATVHSFDYDPDSLACTAELRRRYYPGDQNWGVERGSVLDTAYLAQLGTFDIVYSWGVLHHTGKMWEALDNVSHLVSKSGRLFIAIYNDQGRGTKTWVRVKRAYVSAPGVLKWAVLGPAFLRLWGPTFIRDTMNGRPLKHWRSYRKDSTRGMDPWRDVVDWVGGYPFEVAKPDEIVDFYSQRAFRLEKLTTCGGGLGCNEFVFQRD